MKWTHPVVTVFHENTITGTLGVRSIKPCALKPVDEPMFTPTQAAPRRPPDPDHDGSGWAPTPTCNNPEGAVSGSPTGIHREVDGLSDLEARCAGHACQKARGEHARTPWQ